MEERIQKLLSAAGVCSRRKAEEYITARRVTVNGEPAQLGQRADPDRDDIRVDGRPLTDRPETVYLMLNKPRGYVTTLSDERGRPTVADLVANCGVRVYPVGRLDLDSEGLLLLTNDGALTERLLHPRHQVDKTYRVWVYGQVAGAEDRLRSMRELDGEPIAAAQVQVLRRTGGTAELNITIHEGKNRQVRRMCSACGVTVKRLQRVQEHTLKLGTLEIGKWRYLTQKELRELMEH